MDQRLGIIFLKDKKFLILLSILSLFCINPSMSEGAEEIEAVSEIKVQSVFCPTGEGRNSISLPFHKGEELIYDIYYKKVKIGESVLIFHGERKIDGKDVYYITFSTKLPGFEDTEDIYADKETFLPFKVLRCIRRMGAFCTRITEEYDQEAFKVKIKKRGRLPFSKRITIEKDALIQNAILLPYYYRTKPLMAENQEFKITFPTADFDMIFKGKETIRTGLGKHLAYVFTSIPEKFTFWLSADKKRIPLKIKGYNVGGYALVIRSVKDMAQ